MNPSNNPIVADGAVSMGYTLPPGAVSIGSLPPAGALMCPITHPFTKYGVNNNIVESCCKCQQTGCEEAAAGTNFNNIGGVEAMMADNDVVDKSKFFYYLSTIHRECFQISSR